MNPDAAGPAFLEPQQMRTEMMLAGVTVPEIAAKYGRPVKTIRTWMYRYDWPDPVKKRGRLNEYNPGEVEAAVRAILALGGDGADMDELLDMKTAAGEAGISYATVRADISRGRWPPPDEDRDGVKRWTRRTVRQEMASRRPNKRRKASGTGDEQAGA
jgi:hypothetical protein